MITFIARTRNGYPLSAYEVFTTLGYLNIMRQTVILAVAISFRVGSELRVGFIRFEEFLRLSETDPRVPLDTSSSANLDAADEKPDSLELKPIRRSPGAKVVVQNLTCAWVPDRPVLHDVSLTLEPGALFCVAGPVGSGAVLLAEMRDAHNRLRRQDHAADGVAGRAGADARHSAILGHDGIRGSGGPSLLYTAPCPTSDAGLDPDYHHPRQHSVWRRV